MLSQSVDAVGRLVADAKEPEGRQNATKFVITGNMVI